MDRRRRVAVLAAVVLTTFVAACTTNAARREPPATRSSAVARATSPAPPLTPTPTGTACPLPTTGFDCDLQQRIVAADTYLAGRPGTVGYVVRDRTTGAVHRNADAARPVWTASTIKLAMVVALHEWDDTGRIRLTDRDRADVEAMLHSSDDDAADRLWFAYADVDGSVHQAWNHAFAAYGMTGLTPRPGFTAYFPYWGFQTCTPDDLDALDQYLLTRVPAAERDHVVADLQQVDPDQRWGVWGAGPAAAPGNKDGWSLEQGGWVVNSVGFAGPGQRWTLAVMNALGGAGDDDDGRTTVTHLAELLFAGRS